MEEVEEKPEECHSLDPKKCDGPCGRRYVKRREPKDPKYVPEEVLAASNIYYGDLKRCSKCRSVRYCSRECQTGAWATHKSECRAIGRRPQNASGESARDQVKRELEAMDTESEKYRDIAERELAIYQRLTNGARGFEAMAFPMLFITGRGHYGEPGAPPVRFKDHRERLVYYYDGRFRNNQGWMTWSKSIERQIYDALVTELAEERLSSVSV